MFPVLQSRLASIEFQAYQLDSLPIQTIPICLDAKDVAAAHFYERRIGGWHTGIHDGLMVIRSEAALARLSSVLDQLGSCGSRADIATVQVLGLGSPPPRNSRLPLPPEIEGKIASRVVREILPLSDTYEEFVRNLGQSTRRNFLNCRECARTRGFEFTYQTSVSLPLDPHLAELAQQNIPGPVKARSLREQMRFVAIHNRQFHVAMLDAQHNAVSIAGGFFRGDIALLIYQNNHRKYSSMSPSLMLRAHLIETLIAQNIRHLVFVDGCSGLLSHSCQPVELSEILLVRSTLFANLKHVAAKAIAGQRSRRAQLSPIYVQM